MLDFFSLSYPHGVGVSSRSYFVGLVLKELALLGTSGSKNRGRQCEAPVSRSLTCKNPPKSYSSVREGFCGLWFLSCCVGKERQEPSRATSDPGREAVSLYTGPVPRPVFGWEDPGHGWSERTESSPAHECHCSCICYSAHVCYTMAILRTWPPHLGLILIPLSKYRGFFFVINIR